eukprot:CAMPEP_0170192044 /NCGR_PEP_ID=MMETSP0040_2-20121228/53190_1 /TAXON_ID=641309 /ORGANISM="Lotharella oceanica, Strain CCMP622" /LENGTH=77 /DNA_ID=CAMNT_0010440287 /DNA_START=42 /DNA_END=275 /DNA_ORIENTATION=-
MQSIHVDRHVAACCGADMLDMPANTRTTPTVTRNSCVRMVRKLQHGITGTNSCWRKNAARRHACSKTQMTLLANGDY